MISHIENKLFLVFKSFDLVHYFLINLIFIKYFLDYDN